MINKLWRYKFNYLIFLAWFSFTTMLNAYDNVAAKYCTAMGYSYSIERNKHGEVGMCTLPDNSKVDAWVFYKGKVAKNFSYCEKNHYQMKTKTLVKNGYSVEVPMCESALKQGSREVTSMLEMMKNNQDIHLREENSPVRTGESTPPKRSSKKTSDQPDNLDWRDYDGHAYIGAVRNQGSCGSCYAFGASAAAEGSYNKVNELYDDDMIDFSEDYIAWCLGTYGPYKDDFDGCEGASYAYEELKALTVEGVTYEANYPYEGEDPGSCTHDDDPTVVFEEWGRISSNDTDAMKDAIATYGVIDVAVNADSDWSNYSGGIFSDDQTDCPNDEYTEVNHAVALVGWGTDSEEGLYWILRNSWGASWGEDGYMRTKVTSGRVACAATYLKAIVDPDQCTYAMTPDSKAFAKEGGSGSIDIVSSPDGCSEGSWDATESLDWITLTGTTEGTGSGSWSIPYDVSKNVNTTSTRRGEIIIGNDVFKISQEGADSVSYYDRTTSLMWQDQPHTEEEADAYDNNEEAGKVLRWENALNYCSNLKLNNYTDWHLPTDSELLSIVDEDNTPAIKSGFKYALTKGYWTSTEKDTEKAYDVAFYNGNLGSYDKTRSAYIRCVRPHEINMPPSIIMYLLH